MWSLKEEVQLYHRIQSWLWHKVVEILSRKIAVMPSVEANHTCKGGVSEKDDKKIPQKSFICNVVAISSNFLNTVF